MDPANEERFEELLRRARHGDRRSYARLIEEQRPGLVRSIQTMMARPLRRYLEPEDVFQDAALAGIESITRLEARDLPGFRSWFLGIARNRVRLARERIRDKTHPRKNTPIPASRLAYQAPNDLEHIADPSQATPTPETGPVLARLSELRSEQRLALLLRDVFGASWDTVAFVLERPTEMAARQVHRRARRRMAAKLGEPAAHSHESGRAPKGTWISGQGAGE